MAVSDWLGPSLALVGTIAATCAGLYQWRKGERQRRNARFTARRAEVLEVLLTRLQQVQLASRSRGLPESGLKDQTAGLNRYLIEHKLWLEPDEERLAREYLDVLLEIDQAIEKGAADDLELYIGTHSSLYGEDVAHLFVRLGNAESGLVRRVRQVMKT